MSKRPYPFGSPWQTGSGPSRQRPGCSAGNSSAQGYRRCSTPPRAAYSQSASVGRRTGIFHVAASLSQHATESFLPAHGNRRVPYTLGGALLALCFGGCDRRFRRSDFRTGPVGVHCCHHRNLQFLRNGPPTEALFVTESHNFVTPEDSTGPSKRFAVCTRRTNASNRALTNEGNFHFCEGTHQMKKEPAHRVA